MIVARIVKPASKLATARGLDGETFFSSLGEVLGLEGADEDQLYLAMYFLLERKEKIETHLAKLHLMEWCLVLYDVSSTSLEGKACPLAKYGYNRDKKRSKWQIVFGLLCNDKGCPIAVEVFEGNTSDPKTFTNQIDKVSSRFGIKRVVWVGDRGMITQAKIREDLKDKEGLD